MKRFFHATLLLACLLQFTLPFHAVYAAPTDQKQAQQAALFGDTFLICTAEGFKWVSWEDLQEAQHEPAKHQDYECALCFAQSHFGKHIAATAIDAAIPSSQHTAVYDSEPYALASNITTPYQSRAPPA